LTKLLEQAFTKYSKLPEEEQNVLARVILEELEAEQKWDALFEKSSDLLEELANEALKEHKAGKTKQLDPDQLSNLSQLISFDHYLLNFQSLFDAGLENLIVYSKVIHITQVFILNLSILLNLSTPLGLQGSWYPRRWTNILVLDRITFCV